jgi:uncharacterized membrane protein YphA (DoxX/SURF4 family)
MEERIVQTAAQTAPASKAMLWAGWILTALTALLFLASGVMKFLKPPGFAEEFGRLGYAESLAVGIAIVEIACAILYAIPQTSVLGAILLTAYLGGATATHVRIGDAFFSPIILGVLVWGGLYLRDARIRALVPLRR